MMTTPLPLSVELAKEVEGRWSGEVGQVERDAALIDARIRPLMEALTLCRTMLSSISDSRPDWIGAREALVAADAALKGTE